MRPCPPAVSCVGWALDMGLVHMQPAGCSAATTRGKKSAKFDAANAAARPSSPIAMAVASTRASCLDGPCHLRLVRSLAGGAGGASDAKPMPRRMASATVHGSSFVSASRAPRVRLAAVLTSACFRLAGCGGFLAIELYADRPPRGASA